MNQHKRKDNGVQLPFNDLDFINKWQEWLQYRAERKLARYVPTGLKGTFTRLKKLSDDNPQVAVEIIQQSMDNNWQGLFKLKEVKYEQQQQPVSAKATRESVNDLYNQRFGNGQ